MRRILTIARQRYQGSTVEAFLKQLNAVRFIDTIVLFAAALLLSLLPFMILLSSLAGHSIEADITRHIGLDAQGSEIVSQLFRTSDSHPVAETVLGFAVAVAGSISLAGCLQSIYVGVFEPRTGRPPGQKSEVLRSFMWVAVLVAVLVTGSVIDSQEPGPPGRTVLNAIVAFVGTASFFWWSMHFLLAGRVRWRSLLPSALAVAVLWIALEGFAALYFSSSIISDSRTYGSIGVVFTLMTWFIAIGAVIVLGTTFGATWSERRRPATEPRRPAPP